MNGIKNSGDFSLSKEEIENVFEKCGLPLNIRGEALTLEQFAMLANCIYEMKNKQRYKKNPGSCSGFFLRFRTDVGDGIHPDII